MIQYVWWASIPVALIILLFMGLLVWAIAGASRSDDDG